MYDNPGLDVVGAEMLAALCARDGACPRSTRMEKHNHLSNVLPLIPPTSNSAAKSFNSCGVAVEGEPAAPALAPGWRAGAGARRPLGLRALFCERTGRL